jgi:hypothetical protein
MMVTINQAEMAVRHVQGQSSSARMWSRALELTAPIARRPERIFPTVIEELAEKRGDAPALLSDGECLTFRALAERSNRVLPMGDRPGTRRRRRRLPPDAELP